MGTTAEKLQAIMNSKAAIKSAIETKGQTVGNIPLDEYSSKIMDIQTGYNGEVLTVNIRTNQPDAVVPTSGIKVVINNTLETIIRDWPGYEISEKIPPGYSTEVSVTGAIGGFRNPMIQTFAPFPDNVRPLIFTYESEKVTVNVTKDDGAAVSDVNLTVTNVLDGSIFYSGVAGTGIVMNIPFGTTCRVVTTAIYGYIHPDEQTFTASAVNRTISMAYKKIFVSRIVQDDSISDPANISGDVNGLIIQQIRAKFRRCLAKQSADGQMTIRYLKDDNSNFYDDDTPTNLSGAEGDVMVYFPRFYYKYENLGEHKFAYSFSLEELDNTWKESSESLVGAYEGHRAPNDKLKSETSRDPMRGSYDMLTSLSRGRGKGYQLIDYDQHKMIAWLFYAIYGTRHCQSVCGSGTYSIKRTGMTNNIGNADTTKSSGSSMSINFLGIENCWGNLSEWIDNVQCEFDVWLIVDKVTGNTRTSVALRTSGTARFISKIMCGEYLDIIASEGNGSTSGNYCDSFSAASSGRYSVLRSGSASLQDGGVAYLNASMISATGTVETGSRLAFRGIITEASSVAEFKAIPITN